MTYHAKVISGGKIVIPAELRRELAIRDGDSLVIERDETGALVVRTYQQVVREVQARFRALLPPDYDGSLTDELLSDRRNAARREDTEFTEAQSRTT